MHVSVHVSMYVWMFVYHLCTQKTCINRVQKETRLGRTTIQWEICKQLEFNHTDKWYEQKGYIQMGL